jgi:hypothetical protein
MSISQIKTVVDGDTIYAADWNSEIQQLITQVNTNITNIAANSADIVNLKKYAPQHETIWIPAGAMIPRITNGAEVGTKQFATQYIMQDYLAFDTATEEYAAVNIVMPEAWDLGTVKLKFFWAPVNDSGSVGDTVEWEVAALAISNADDLITALGSSQVISDALLAGEPDTLHVTAATPALTIGGTPALGDLVHFRISRNVGGTDNFGYDALLFGVLIQYTLSETVAAW